jgi:hypothetical protein
MRAARRRIEQGNGQGKATVVTQVMTGGERDGALDRLPVGEQGRLRFGLEQWLEKRAGVGDLPEVTVEAARVLADELDADTGASPLWGRFTHLLELLTAPETQAQAFIAEAAAIYESLGAVAGAESWRSVNQRDALERGDDPARWERIVPVGCVRGRHRPHNWGGGVAVCLDCETTLEVPSIRRVTNGSK